MYSLWSVVTKKKRKGPFTAEKPKASTVKQYDAQIFGESSLELPMEKHPRKFKTRCKQRPPD